MTPETEKWLQEVRTRRAKAEQVISDLNHCKRQWTMSVPARPDVDPDLVISASLADNNRLATLVTEQAEEIKRLGFDHIDRQNLCCTLAGPTRGDCEHFIGIPAVLDETAIDEYGRPREWCFYCWMSHKQRLLERELESLRSEANRAGLNTLAEVLSDEETGDLEANEIMFNRGVKHAVEVVERKRVEWQAGYDRFAEPDESKIYYAKAADEILAELKGRVMAELPTREHFDGVIGRLDRLLSEFLLLTKAPIDQADIQTLKHHADDLIGVGQKALSNLGARYPMTDIKSDSECEAQG